MLNLILSTDALKKLPKDEIWPDDGETTFKSLLMAYNYDTAQISIDNINSVVKILKESRHWERFTEYENIELVKLKRDHESMT